MREISLRLTLKKLRTSQTMKICLKVIKKFVDEAMGKIWTIEYDPSYLNPPVLVVFKEDPLPKQKKWLFYIDYLERVVQ